MATELEMELARDVYELICDTLDNQDWKYNRLDEDLIITTGARGEDLPIDLLIAVNPDAQVVSVLSPMPYKIPEDKRVDAAVAVCTVNDRLINGCFDFDITTGDIQFRLVNSYRDSDLGEELINYMVLVSCSTIDTYNDKFLAVSKDLMSIEQFIKGENRQ